MIIKLSILKKINYLIFFFGVVGFIASALLIDMDGARSMVVYNTSLALVVCSIGIKVLFLEKE